MMTDHSFPETPAEFELGLNPAKGFSHGSSLDHWVACSHIMSSVKVYCHLASPSYELSAVCLFVCVSLYGQKCTVCSVNSVQSKMSSVSVSRSVR